MNCELDLRGIVWVTVITLLGAQKGANEHILRWFFRFLGNVGDVTTHGGYVKYGIVWHVAEACKRRADRSAEAQEAR